MKYQEIIEFIRHVYNTNNEIPLHAPKFIGNEQKYVSETIKTTYVSSVGKYVDKFESLVQLYTETKKAVATVNGTAALSLALYASGVKSNDLVITQSLTFVATGNAIYHIGAEPIFIDVSLKSLSLCPVALSSYLDEFALAKDDGTYHKKTGQKISAIMPMHTFGHPAQLDELMELCSKWNIEMIEDAAESLGSYYKGKHTGTIGRFGALSFNGNKVITTGGGGMVVCKSEEDGKYVKHISTTAKVQHPYEFIHDEPGFNYRMPNLNAALGCAQFESLQPFLSQKRILAKHYENFFSNSEFDFFKEPDYGKSNYWLNAVICQNKESRDSLLKTTNEAGIMTRPAWKLLHKLPMFSSAMRDELINSDNIESRLVNLPSSPIEISA